MSLIPSESYSFPDHFTSTKAASRKPKAQAERVPVEPPRNKPAIVALPNPKPQPAPVAQRPQPQPMQSKPALLPPNPAIRRASAPPPRIAETPPTRKIPLPPTLKPKVRWNNRAPAIDPATMPQNGAEQFHQAPPPPEPAQNVIQMKPAKPVAAPRAIARPAPEIVHNQIPPPPPARSAAPKSPAQPQPARQVRQQVAVQNPQADFFQMFAATGETAISKRRRKSKMRRFLICESIAVAILLPLATLGLAHRPESATLVWIMNIATITAAVAAALIPILFFAATPTLPEIER